MAASTFVTSDGVRLGYEVAGDGRPIFWQHGLGADRGQPAEVFPDVAGWRRITLECRGHGESETGDEDKLSVATFSEDVRGLARHLGLSTYAIGGISLGAAIALRVAALAPEAVTGLIGDLKKGLGDLAAALGHDHDEDPLVAATFTRDHVLPAMDAVRTAADALEGIVADDLWSLPTYQEMLYIL